MALNGNLIAIIGRIHPAIYDVVFPRGPVFEVAHAVQHAHLYAHRAADLNPQPLPPKEIFTGIETGAAVGHELVRAAGFAKAFGLEFAFDIIDICPPPRPRFPWPWPWPWPFPWPPRPYPWRLDEIGPEFDRGFGLGLGAVLEATADVWQPLPAAGFLEKLYGAASDLAQSEQYGKG